MTISDNDKRRLACISHAFDLAYNACRASAVIAGFEYHAFASAADRYVPADGSCVPLNYITDADRLLVMPRAQRESTNIYNDFDRALCMKLVAMINQRKYMPKDQMNVSINNTRQTLLAVWSEFDVSCYAMYIMSAVTKALHFHGMCSSSVQIRHLTEYLNTIDSDRLKIMNTPGFDCVTLDTAKLLTHTRENAQECSSSQRVWMLECINRVINIDCINAARKQFVDNKIHALLPLNEYIKIKGCCEQNYWIYVCAHECFADQTRRRAQFTVTSGFMFFLQNWRDQCLELCTEKKLYGSLVVGVVLAGVRCMFRMYFTSGRLFGDQASITYRRSLINTQRNMPMSDLVRFMNERVFTQQIDNLETCRRDYTLITNCNGFEYLQNNANPNSLSRFAHATKLFEFIESSQQENANASMLVCPSCRELVHYKDGAVFHAMSEGTQCLKICCGVCWNKLVYASECQKKAVLHCPSCRQPAKQTDMVPVDLMTHATIKSLLVRCKIGQCRAVVKCDAFDAHIDASHPGANAPSAPQLGRVMKIRDGQCLESQLKLWTPEMDLNVVPRLALWRQDRDLYAHQFWDFNTFNSNRAPRMASRLLSSLENEEDPTLAGMLERHDAGMQVFMCCTQMDMTAIFEHRLQPENNLELPKNQYRDQIKFWHKLACEFDSGPFAIVDPATPIHAVLLHASHSAVHADRIAEIFGFKSSDHMRQCFATLLQLSFEDKMRLACKLVAPAHAQFIRNKYNL